jgi:hypothetical protein
VTPSKGRTRAVVARRFRRTRLAQSREIRLGEI